MKAVRKRINSNDEIKEWLNNFPVKKTCDLAIIGEYVSYVVPKLQQLVFFFSSNKNKSLKFKSTCRRKKTFDKTVPSVIVAVLPQEVQRDLKSGLLAKDKVVVAFGNAYIDPSSRGNAQDLQKPSEEP